MIEPTPSFVTRLLLAFRTFFKVLLEPDFAASVQRLQQGGSSENTGTAVLRETSPDSALQVLGLLQREGRFIDFIEEDVSEYSDADIGAAVRVVHQGCRKVLREHFGIEPVRSEDEGSPVTLEPGFDAAALRPTGNVVGEPPFSGTLAHRGWRAAEVRLPKLATGHDTAILAPAEVEL